MKMRKLRGDEKIEYRDDLSDLSKITTLKTMIVTNSLTGEKTIYPNKI